MEQVAVNDATEIRTLGRVPKGMNHDIGFEQVSTEDLPMGKPRQQRPTKNRLIKIENSISLNKHVRVVAATHDSPSICHGNKFTKGCTSFPFILLRRAFRSNSTHSWDLEQR